MLKKALMGGLIVIFLGIVFASCSEDTREIEEEAENKSENTTKTASGEEKEEEKDEEDIWTHYEDATWEGDWRGLESEIQIVSVTDDIEEDADGNSSAVGVKFKIENTTEHKFDTYPDQATLITSTGEQVEANLIASDSIGGDIGEGVIKEGVVLFFLERGDAESIEWVNLEWNTTDDESKEDEDYGDMRETNEVKLELE